jgi:hypothetical protein
MAAGTVTATKSAYNAHGQGEPKTLTIAWTSDASGAVNGNLSPRIAGEIIQIETNPGSPAPTDNYDAVLLDAAGFDVARGLLTDRDTITTETVVPIIETTLGANVYGNRVWVASTLELQILNAGVSKQGVVTVLYH